MFEHPAIYTVIQEGFFTSSKPAFNIGILDRAADGFEPFSYSLIAFACTAVCRTLAPVPR